MKLIDADALLRNLKEERGRYDTFGSQTDHEIVMALMNVIGMTMNAPTIDAVEVVRCKDCKWSRPSYPLLCHKGKALTIIEHENCFCSYGERKTE